jgi:hypothetical protein
MKVLLLLIFVVWILFGCNQTDNHNAKLLGKWTTKNLPVKGQIAEIRIDSVYYPHYQLSFRYELTKDSIKIYFTDKTFEAKYLLNADTLYFFSGNTVDTVFRIR